MAIPGYSPKDSGSTTTTRLVDTSAPPGTTRLVAGMVIAACADLGQIDLSPFTVAGVNLYRGRVCGRDMGKPAVRIQPRNAPCVCGSGQKAKRCCINFPKEQS